MTLYVLPYRNIMYYGIMYHYIYVYPNALILALCDKGRFVTVAVYKHSWFVYHLFNLIRTVTWSYLPDFLKAKHDVIRVKVPSQWADHRSVIPIRQYQICSRCKRQMADQYQKHPIYYNLVQKLCLFLDFHKNSVCAYLSSLYARAMLRHTNVWSLGQSQKSTTMAHGFVYNNRALRIF